MVRHSEPAEELLRFGAHLHLPSAPDAFRKKAEHCASPGGRRLQHSRPFRVLAPALGTGPGLPGSVHNHPYRSGATMQTTTTGTGGNVATDETDRLIASDKVEGTAVYNRQGERLGSVYNFMVDKRSGQVAYAVMSFGGFLGVGGSYHPLPWRALTYDTGKGGYVVDLDKDRLRGAPSYAESETPNWGDPAYGRRIDDYYGSAL
jgi:hypothetical protein